jgi:argininosuccinate lyase
MEYLILRGVPMRTGHEIVGKLVADCESKSCCLSDLSTDELQQACDKIEADVSDVLGTRNAVAALTSDGSGGPTPVNEQLARWRKILGIDG